MSETLRPIICSKCKGQNWNIFRVMDDQGNKTLKAKCSGCGATLIIRASEPSVTIGQIEE